MLINQLSKQTGVSIHTLRYYENLGLIHGEADDKVKTNNYKNYSDEVAEKVEIIKEAKEVGFTLLEIKKMLESWYGSSSPREEQLALFSAKITEIETKIRQLKMVKKRLEKVKEQLEKGECDSD